MGVGMKFVSLLLLCMVVAPICTQATITCGQVATSLGPCINYLRGSGAPSPGCCNGVKAINSAAKTTVDRQAACNCLKSAAAGINGLKPELAASLPGKCSVNIPYKISMNTNCKSIK